MVLTTFVMRQVLFTFFRHLLLLSCWAVLFSSSPHDAVPAPTAKRKMRHLVLLPLLFTWLARIVLAQFIVRLSSFCFFVLVVVHTTDLRHACFVSYFDVCLGRTASANFFRVDRHAGRLKTDTPSFVFSSPNITDPAASEHGCASSRITNRPFLLLIGIL